MATEIKTRKYSKEQMVIYLEKHESNMTEAANIAGTNPRTLGRYLAQGVIPSEWYTKITAALKDRKPAAKVEKKEETKVCSACGKVIPNRTGANKVKEASDYNCDAYCLKGLGVETIPVSGWHWFTNRKGERVKMYPICEKCNNKLNSILSARKKTVKAKISKTTNK